ncbi:MAG TPA: Uma2 family endonuclease [Hanamia sp.]|nr:Uma2 family endonuclease [Hanamia sp.]
MTNTLIHPPKTMQEVWESLPEGTLCQLINNKLIMSPAPLNIHQVILNNINVEISIFLRAHKLGEVRIAPFDVYFSKENVLQPDLIFIKNENLKKIQNKGLFGAPDIVIEILSPTTSQLDYEDKKIIYERFGVKEYFIVDPSTKNVDSFFLRNESFEKQAATIAEIRSFVIGTNINF